MKPACSVDGCAKTSEKRTWCGMHYQRWRAHGDLECTLKAANGAGYVQGGYLGHQVNGVRKFDHVLIAEKALGKPLPIGAVVHHWDEDKKNNSPDNLLICPDRAYHNLLHARMAAMEATGDPTQRKCRHCGKYDLPANLRLYQTRAGSSSQWHVQCARDAAKLRSQQ